MKEEKLPPGRYLSIPEVASLLGMSRVAVYRKVRAGEIRAIRIGRTYGIPRSYVSNLLGEDIDRARKLEIRRAVKRAVREYGDLLRKLGRE
jgi:excisionase family DNA binding protein